MKRLALFATLLMGFSGLAMAQASPYQEGVHYVKFDLATAPRKSNFIPVTEIFSYACHACNEFEPYIQSWKSRQAEDVQLDRMPVGFGRRAWELLAQGYMMADVLGVADENHEALMDAIWKDRRQFRSIEDLADFYGEQGVDREKYLSLDGSFALKRKQNEANNLLGIYSPRQTPTMVVAGKYKIQTGQHVPSYQAMLGVVDFLVSQERAMMMSSKTSDTGAVAAEAETATQ